MVIQHESASVQNSITRLFGYGNVGDEALCSVLLKELRETSNTEITVISSNPLRTSQFHNVQSCHEKLASVQFIKQLLTSNVLMFAGGGKYGWPTIKRVCIMALLAKLLGKKVIIRNLGLYPFPWFSVKIAPKPPESLIKRAIILLAFSLADKISVRDHFSERFLRLCHVKKPIEVEADIALKLKPSSFEHAASILSNHVYFSTKKLCVGVNFRTLRRETNEKIMNVMPNILDWIIEAFDAEVVFVPFGYGSTTQRFWDDDTIIAEEIRSRMNQKSRFRIITNEHRPEDILGVLGLFDLFIGMRYHSIVFSEVIKVPTVALIYDTKTEYFLKQNGCKINSIWVDELSEGKIKEAIQNILNQSHSSNTFRFHS